MKKNEVKDLIAKEAKELKTQVIQLKNDLAKIIIERNSGKLINTSLVAKKKKDIARLLTVLRHKELQRL